MTTELYTALISAGITVVGALVTFIVSFLKTKVDRQRLDTLEEFINGDDTEYYVECPKCGNKIILNKVKILINKQNKEEE